MFEIGFWELVMVGVVALIVVGPERLPGLARTAGLWLGKARRMIADVKAEVDRELQLDELKQSLRQQTDQSGIKDLADRVKSLREDIQAEFDDPGPPPGWQRGMPTAAPPPDWTPPAPNPKLSADAAEPIPVQLRKPALLPVSLQKIDPPPTDLPAAPAPQSPQPPAAN